ncbi:MAG: hypothetical protein NC177_16815 [Ruminococcus flavefaciens]|nr:hypothetical protein [Ruminococcus flavefaciens]
MKNHLKSVQWLRNAAAHNNCIINHLSGDHQVNTVNREVCNFISKIHGISTKTREKKMSNRPIHDFIVMLYVFNNVVSSEDIKYYTMKELKELFEGRFTRNKDYFKNNLLIMSNYEFVKKIIDFFFDLSYNK